MVVVNSPVTVAVLVVLTVTKPVTVFVEPTVRVGETVATVVDAVLDTVTAARVVVGDAVAVASVVDGL